MPPPLRGSFDIQVQGQNIAPLRGQFQRPACARERLVEHPVKVALQPVPGLAGIQIERLLELTVVELLLKRCVLCLQRRGRSAHDIIGVRKTSTAMEQEDSQEPDESR